jgi:curved DNA-binding protein CbpA
VGDSIRKLAARLAEMSYFELLGVSVEADPLAIRDAYYATLRRYHPDRYLGAGPDYQRELARICARIGEAYRCLSHPARRAEYLGTLRRGETRARPSRRTTLGDSRDPRGEKARVLLAGAQALAARGNRAAARAKLELALQFEPDSAALRQALEVIDPSLSTGLEEAS